MSGFDGRGRRVPEIHAALIALARRPAYVGCSASGHVAVIGLARLACIGKMVLGGGA